MKHYVEEQLTQDLNQIQMSLTEKLGRSPYLNPSVAYVVDQWTAICWAKNKSRDGEELCLMTAASDPEEAVKGLMAKVEEMDPPEKARLREFHRKVAEAIDYGNQHGIDAQWVNPLQVMSKKLSRNALEDKRT